jgi:Protein of unknown function DUF262
MAGKPERKAPTTKDIGLLHQLWSHDQLELRPDFQRQSVWPRPAKQYLIDTILNDRPIPLLFFSHATDAQTGRLRYAVVDGQQRLRAIFEFMEDRFPLAVDNSARPMRWSGRRYSALHTDDRDALLAYDLPIVELKNYREPQIRDIFIRMNRFGVKLNAAELRHAYEEGAFKLFVEELGGWAWWVDSRVITATQQKRMRPVEFAAELVILLLEGPQDKKDSVDLYYERYQDEFEFADEVQTRLLTYIEWIAEWLPDFSSSRWRKPVDLYALIGALDHVTRSGDVSLAEVLEADAARARLLELDNALKSTTASRKRGNVGRYAAAAARQTDNVQPRQTRIEVLTGILAG